MESRPGPSTDPRIGRGAPAHAHARSLVRNCSPNASHSALCQTPTSNLAWAYYKINVREQRMARLIGRFDTSVMAKLCIFGFMSRSNGNDSLVRRGCQIEEALQRVAYTKSVVSSELFLLSDAMRCMRGENHVQTSVRDTTTTTTTICQTPSRTHVCMAPET